MRIISGRFKGRVLTSFQEDHIRPTTDRVKESLFNKWMGTLEDAQVLDLFSGTGSLGLEALSRGASRVDFVEQNVRSIQILKKNIDLLKLSKDEYSILKQDVLAYLKKYQGPAYAFILIDPPFTEKMAHDVMLALDSSNCFDENTLIAIESQKKERMDDAYTNLYRYDFNDYGDKLLSFFAKKAQDA
ncbi:MAG: 16S rRNA (guanine(966)-N(2))-methyltransferase RsmD [Bdellovibrionaceae bacterium]|nr:16S rRNA (guanine(966)-N(2))-methyltransferase RsmD [Bdellovibrio sp.]